MSRIMSMPLVYKDREWQTIVSICALQNEMRLRVNILNSQLARQLGSDELFIFRDGEIIHSNAHHSKKETVLHVTVKRMLHLYMTQYMD